MDDKILLTSEKKKSLLLKLGLNAKEVMLLANCHKSKAYAIMDVCRKEFNGRAGLMSNLITPRSLCLALGTTIEEQLSIL